MGLLTYTITRTCAVCGKPLRVRILKVFNRILSGGVYFDLHVGIPSHEEAEYWECAECYKSNNNAEA